MQTNYIRSILACERLYAITDCSLPDQELITITRSLLEAGINLLQYRNKSKNTNNLGLGTELRRLCYEYDTVFIVNDDVNLALDLDADGVHLGEHDISLTEARTLLPDKIIGISCYDNFDRAITAQQSGADYVAFGSFFTSTTKPQARIASTDLLIRARKDLSIPIVAIGGICTDNAAELISAGADYLAVISGLYQHPKPYDQAKQYLSLFEE